MGTDQQFLGVQLAGVEILWAASLPKPPESGFLQSSQAICNLPLQASPLLLEPGALAGVLGELRRLFGAKTPPGRLLQNAPDLALSCQSLQSQSRGERDYDYLRDIFSGGGGPMAALGGGGGGAGGGGGPGGGGGAGDSAPGCDEGAEA